MNTDRAWPIPIRVYLCFIRGQARPLHIRLDPTRGDAITAARITHNERTGLHARTLTVTWPEWIGHYRPEELFEGSGAPYGYRGVSTD